MKRRELNARIENVNVTDLELFDRNQALVTVEITISEPYLIFFRKYGTKTVVATQPYRLTMVNHDD